MGSVVEDLVTASVWLLTGFEPAGALDELLARAGQFWAGFTGYYSRISLIHLLAAVPFAAFAWKLHHAPGDGFDPRAFLRYLFPREIYFHPSARVDLKIYAFNLLFRPASLLLFGVSLTVATIALAELARDSFGAPAQRFDSSAPSIILLGILLLLLTDISTYVTHRLSHQFKPLWAFHRVHHSAPVLTPLTLMRKHPIYDLVASVVDIIILAPMKAAVIYYWPEDVGAAMTGITAFGFAAFGLIAGNLRHSHVWLSFGPVFNRLMVSPALHQIHHSKALRHWDRNYGEVFAIWDWMFGTLYLPRERETLEFGVNDHPDPHPTWRHAMAEPFGYLWRWARGRSPSRVPAS